MGDVSLETYIDAYFYERPQLEAPKKKVYGYDIPEPWKALIGKLHLQLMQTQEEVYKEYSSKYKLEQQLTTLQAEKDELNIVVNHVTQFNQELIRDKERLETEVKDCREDNKILRRGIDEREADREMLEGEVGRLRSDETANQIAISVFNMMKNLNPGSGWHHHHLEFLPADVVCDVVAHVGFIKRLKETIKAALKHPTQEPTNG